MEKISVVNFRTWQRDPVTQVFMAKLKENFKLINMQLLTDNTLLGDRDVLVELSAQRRILGMILELKPEDLIDEKS